ncbi:MULTISPECIES: hypothetical protein [Stenotrophomonas]|uniref:hypothetical protein n=1 Tax=Stenotrophomonas maltophilia group TaxID=995085 RepID=UPI0015DE1FCA|nr:hypothetical protein [Stenotrophomonas maltophilia]
MSKSTDALTALLNNWEQLKTQRPGEADFSTYGYPLSYASMDDLFGRWKQTLATLDGKGYWNSSPEVGIADAPIAAQLNNLSSLVSSATSNGVSWLLSSQFLDAAHITQSQLSALTRRQANLSREVAKLLAERSTESFELVIGASDAAKNLLRLDKDAAESAQKIAGVAQSVETASTLAEATNARLVELAKEAEDSAAIAEAKKEDVVKLLKAASDRASQAGSREKELSTRAEEVRSQLEETDKLARSAYKSVEDALRKVRDQGLAKSFQDRSNNLQHERKLWTWGFAGSTIVLLAVAIAFAIELTSMTYESLLVHLLRKIGLAAPVIWIGWYSARQVGRIARVQEDYEYKAASALAFQSYKEEAKLGGDPELEKKLLEHAIITFGENPVRLYESHLGDPVSPVQAAIKELPPEKIAAILAAVGEQSLKAKFWPLGK